MENDIKIGDRVRLLTTHKHNSLAKNYNINVSFCSDEVGSIIEIIDIENDSRGDFAYKVECNSGITYLRRSAFELVYEPEKTSSINNLEQLLKLIYNE